MYFELKSPKLKSHRNKLTQFAVCVGLFAVLLIYFGPLFSQISHALSSQPTMTSMSMESMEMKTMDMLGHDHAKMLSEQANSKQKRVSSAHISHHGHHAHGESANLLEACGYCSLLFHLNWIDAKTFELIPLLQSRYPNMVTATISHKYHVPFTSLLPRAPPVISV
jgi:hypothetical protein|uniref:DUF2946 domain-containing protein n=1 Tax=Marinomonas sp. (strain MWYL1) TaxID=400668 RepID=A6VWL5_MARMS